MFKQLIDNKKLGGIICMIWKDGHVIYRESQGYRNVETHELMTMDTIFRIASMTKPITSVLAMMLYEEKKFNLDDPITKWFPHFRNMKVLKNQTGEYEAFQSTDRLSKGTFNIIGVSNVQRTLWIWPGHCDGIERKQKWINAMYWLNWLRWLAGCIWWLVVSRPCQKKDFHISNPLYDRIKTTCTGYWI